MDNLETTAVNTAPSTDGATLDTASTGKTDSDNLQTTSPAEVDNTVQKEDLSSKTIPYTRFKEINDKYNELKQLEKFKEFAAYDVETFKALTGFNQALVEDPNLAKAIEDTILSYKGQTKEPEEVLDPVTAKINELKSNVEKMQQRIEQGLVEKNLQDYEKEFNTSVQNDFKTAAEKSLAFLFTKMTLNMRDNNWQQKFNKDLFNSSYQESKAFINKIKQELIDDYIKNSKKIDTPITPNSAIGISTPDFSNKEARMKDAFSAFENIKQMMRTQD